MASGMRTEFKETMDAYEAFVDEYCKFMETYSSSNNQTALLSEYLI